MNVKEQETWLKPAEYEVGRSFDLVIEKEGQSKTQSGKEMPYLECKEHISGDKVYLSAWGIRAKKGSLNIEKGDKITISKKAGLDSRWLIEKR